MIRYVITCLLLMFASALSQEREVKILVLIIDSNTAPVYGELEKIWRCYMHLDPEHIESYFIRGDPDLSQEYEIKGDIIFSKTAECLLPGVLNKTLLSMECLLPRLKAENFDYVLRTNLSSFYYFPNLLKTLKDLPKKQCYFSFPLRSKRLPPGQNINYGSGAGFILSIDLVEELVQNKNELWNCEIIDDAAIGRFFKDKVEIIPAERVVFNSLKKWKRADKKAIKNAYHFRVKNKKPHLRLDHDIIIHKGLLNLFYASL